MSLILLDATRLSVMARYIHKNLYCIYAYIKRVLGKNMALFTTIAYIVYLFTVIIFFILYLVR